MKKRRSWKTILTAIIVALVYQARVGIALVPATISAQTEWVTITRVVDGDTFVVGDDKFRMIGIDTPETVDPRKPVECMGLEASAEFKRLVEGQTVRLEADPSQGDADKYGRLLRYVFLDSDENVGELMIAGGFAHEYTYDEAYKYQAVFQAAEDRARSESKGLWSPNACL